MIDTASAYGDSESVLGEIGVSDFKITTKIPAIPDNQQNIESLKAEERYLGIPSSRENSDMNGSQHSITHGSSTSNMYLSDLSLSKL